MLKANRWLMYLCTERKKSPDHRLKMPFYHTAIFSVLCTVTKLLSPLQHHWMFLSSHQVKWAPEWRGGEYLLPFKGLWESWVLFFFPLSLWVPLCDSLMPRMLLDHYPNPSPQHGMSGLTDSGCSHLKAACLKSLHCRAEGLLHAAGERQQGLHDRGRRYCGLLCPEQTLSLLVSS